MAILGDYEIWNSADMAIWVFIVSWAFLGIYFTWKSPKWLKPLDNRLEKCAKKMRAIIFESEEKHNG